MYMAQNVHSAGKVAVLICSNSVTDKQHGVPKLLPLAVVVSSTNVDVGAML